MKLRLITTTVAVLLLAVVLWAQFANQVYTLWDGCRDPWLSTTDTTAAVTTFVDTSQTTMLPLGRFYQFVMRIDSVKSNSTTTGRTGTDSCLHRIKVQSRLGALPNAYWADVCSLTWGGATTTLANDSVFTIMEKNWLLAADTTTWMNQLGDHLRLIYTDIDSTTSAANGTDGVRYKTKRMFGSVQVAIRQ